MKKNIINIFVLIILFTLKVKSENIITVNCKDTITVVFNKYEDFKSEIYHRDYDSGYYLNDTIYYITNRKVKKNGILMLSAFHEGKFFNCKDQTKYKFFQFYTSENKLIAEGTWDIEGFHGLYKEYYKTGKLQEEGYKNGDIKTNHWKYYDESGKIVKEEEYDDKGKLIFSK